MSPATFALFLAVALVPSLTLREFAKASVADRLGDKTPRMAGRLTLNPVPHIDPLGSIVVPGLMIIIVATGRALVPVFAFAKPMPLNPSNLRDRDKGLTWVALAGPLTNLVLAVAAGLLFRVAGTGTLASFVLAFVEVNVLLCIFHLVPIPGLDGAMILARFLPPRAREVYRNLDQYLHLFVLLAVFLLAAPLIGFVRLLGGSLCEALSGVACPF